MVLTIEQIQENITNGGDVRQIINQLADYVQANPSSPGGDSGYLVYTALLSQSGTDAPVATVLQNTLGGTVTWAYSSVGGYKATIDGGFNVAKTAIFILPGNSAFNGSVETAFADIEANELWLGTKNSAGSVTDDWGAPLSIKIEVYP